MAIFSLRQKGKKLNTFHRALLLAHSSSSLIFPVSTSIFLPLSAERPFSDSLWCYKHLSLPLKSLPLPTRTIHSTLNSYSACPRMEW